MASTVRTRFIRIALTSLVFTVVLALTAGSGAYAVYKYLDGRIPRVDAIPATTSRDVVSPEKQLHAQNYLVLGSDQGSDREGERSDTTMIVHLSPDRTKATIISIPRDAYVAIPACPNPGGGAALPAKSDLFNAAFSEGGAICAVLAAEAVTGIKITHYVSINLAGFVKVINALGNITVCSPDAEFDSTSGLTLAKGDNKLDGAQALQYVRARYGLGDGSDIQRIQRQQRFLGAILREVRGGKLLSNPTTLTSFLNAATSAVTVDQKTSINDLKALFDVLRGLDPAKVTFYTTPIARSNYNPADPSDTTSSFAVHILLDDVAGKQLYGQIINDQTITVGGRTTTAPAPTPTASVLTVAPAAVTVQVTNDTETPGLGATVSAALRAVGFKTVGPLSGTTVTSVTTVTFAATQFAPAQTVAAAFPNSQLVLDSTHTGAITVAVGTEYSALAAVQVGQALPSWVPKTAPAATTVPVTPSINGNDKSCTI